MSTGATQSRSNSKKRELLTAPAQELELPAPPREQPIQAQREPVPAPEPARPAAATQAREEAAPSAVKGAKEVPSVQQTVDISSMKCTTHPWRPAYALCDYCKRPFCYADLVKYGQGYYCLEDIDNISAGTSAPSYGNTSFSHIAGIVLIAGALVLAFFIYPTLVFFVGTIASNGISYLVTTFLSTYPYQAVNLSIMFFNIVFGLLLLSKPRLGFYPGLVVGVLSLIALSYQYFNTGTDYFLLVTAVELAGLAALMYSRMSASAMEVTEQEIQPNDINWPRPEVF